MPTWIDSDLDSADSESGVAHENVTGTDHSNASVLRQGYSYSALPGTPEAYFPLHEDSGSTANDITGNAHDASINGPTLGVTGILGSTCFDFDGTGDECRSGNGYAEGAISLTLNAWIKPASAQDGFFLAKRGGTSGDRSWMLLVRSNPDFQLQTYDSNGNFQTAEGGSYSGGNWYMVTGVVDGDQQRLYVDAGTPVATNTMSTTGIQTSTEDVNIGRRSDGNNPFDGKVAEVGIWEEALSESQIQALYDTVATSGSLIAAEKLL